MRFIRYKQRRLFVPVPVDKVKVGCYFTAQKFRSDGTITYQGPRFSNLVLDVGLDMLVSRPYGLVGGSGTQNNSCSVCNVGTGTTTPTTDQTGLHTFTAATASRYGGTTHGYSTENPVRRWSSVTYEFAIGFCADNTNLTEVGLSRTTNDEYFNRQLFRDEEDNPTTITVHSDEGLRIFCELFLYGDLQPGATVAGSCTLNETETLNYTREMTTDTTWLTWTYLDSMGALGASRESGYLLSDLATGFTGTVADSRSLEAYQSGDYSRTHTAVWNPGKFAGNLNSILFHAFFPPPWGGIGTRVTEFSAFRLDAPIDILDTEEVTVTFRREWARYTP